MSAITRVPPHVLIMGPIPIVAADPPAGENHSATSQFIINRVRTVEQFNQVMKDYPNVDLNDEGCTGWTIMAVAIKLKLLPLVEALFKQDPSLAKKKDAIEPYICKAAGQSKEIVQIFLRNGANVNCSTQQGTTALYISSLNGLNEVTKYLLLHGAVIYQSTREFNLSRLSLLVNKLSYLTHYSGAPACKTGPFLNQIIAIDGQLDHIHYIIDEIEKEHIHSFANFKNGLCKGDSFFGRLEANLGKLVMSFTPNWQLQKQFLEKCASSSLA